MGGSSNDTFLEGSYKRSNPKPLKHPNPQNPSTLSLEKPSKTLNPQTLKKPLTLKPAKPPPQI